ncbi:serine/threonine protein kinase [Calothrix parasitica NIES-267]|uniref:Serine/threonine protein kinase n=1 Tax=Calothrix parasitica NIES-267 TaxID=1973488 RepID=A0A1Z4LN10_9CYAN|nr:serine/threonine protein kinase [Calothrix parasitica NIES-267]
MSENQPKEYDAVLGGRNPAPVDGAVLGGLEGVKRRFASGDENQKITAALEALKYGDRGFEWVIQILDTQSSEFEFAVYLAIGQKAVIINNRRILSDTELTFAPNTAYAQLKFLLMRKKWREADSKTAALMLGISCREKQGFMRVTDIENFPEEDFIIIENLWTKYSQGKFSFAVQARIWQKIGGNSQPDWNAWCRFGKCLGWFQKETWLSWNDITFNIDAPVGHLPRGGAYMGWGLGDFWIGCPILSAMTSKLTNCNLI